MKKFRWSLGIFFVIQNIKNWVTKNEAKCMYAYQKYIM